MAIYIRITILKQSLQALSERKYFSALLSQDWTGRSKQGLGSRADISGRGCVVPLSPPSLGGVDIYNRSSSSESTVLAK